MSSPTLAPRSPARTRRTSTALPIRLLVPLLALVLLGAGLAAAPAAEAARFTPRPGVTFNDPLGGPAARQKIQRLVLRSVGAAPRGSEIRFASWNIRGTNVVDALIAAHRRGVSVRVVMDRKNAYSENKNKAVNLLQQELKRYGNGKRAAEKRSGLTKCRASCRGRTGFGHSKFFLFSKAGRAEQVVINSSANATDLAASNQWNDAFTMVGDATMYGTFAYVFDQMYADEPVSPTYLTATSGSKTAEFFPYTGQGTLPRDPVLQELDRVQCTGATNAPRGRTRIQISMTSWFGDRGIAIANRVRDLKGQGCRFKVVYAVAGGEVVRILRNAGIPLRHIVQDFDGDGVYDRYLHQKAMTIRGVHDGNPGSWVTINGSANWSPLSLVSDDATLHIESRGVLSKYNRYIDRLYRNPPPNRGVGRGRTADRTSTLPRGAGVVGDDAIRPGTGAYAKVEPD